MLLGTGAQAFVSTQMVCYSSYLYAVLLLAQCSAKICLSAPVLILGCSEERREAACHPSLGREPREGRVGQHWRAS